MEWLKKNWLTLLCAFGLAGLAGFEEYQSEKRIRQMKAILVDANNGKPTEWCQTYLFTPMTNIALSRTKTLTVDAFKNEANVAMMTDALGIKAGSIRQTALLGTNVLHVMDSMNVDMGDFAALFAENAEADSDSYVRGQYMYNKETNKATHIHDIEDGWRELYFSLPDSFKKLYCRPFYWYLKKDGTVKPDRISSTFVKCN